MLSVVIPTFDRVVSLTNALDSLLLQLPLGSEVIVVDDGSSDSTVAKCTEMVPIFGHKGVVLRLIQLPHTGNVSGVRNAGAKQAAGDVLLFMDSDVQLDVGFLRQTLMFLTSQDSAGCVGGLVFDGAETSKVYSSGVRFSGQLSRILYAFRPAEVQTHPYSVDVVSHVFLVRSVLFHSVGGFDEEIRYLGDETILQLRLAERGHSSFVVPSAVAFHHKPAPGSLRRRSQSYQEWGHSAMLSEAVLVQRRLLSRNQFRVFLFVHTLRMASVELLYLIVGLTNGRLHPAVDRAKNAVRTYLRILQQQGG